MTDIWRARDEGRRAGGRAFSTATEGARRKMLGRAPALAPRSLASRLTPLRVTLRPLTTTHSLLLPHVPTKREEAQARSL